MRLTGLQLAVSCLIITASVADDTDQFWNNYIALIKTLDKYGYGDEIRQNYSHNPVDANFDCRSSMSPEKPTSVNMLRPGDIDVIAALGDSLTAANGAGADTLIGVAIEYRGLSSPIGGDDDLERVVTLANIMRKYNSELYGFSTGTGSVNNPKSKLNVAIPGAVSAGMPGQARDLVEHLRDDPYVDFDNDWKLVTLFIGGNDLCRQCQQLDRFSPENYVAHIEEAIEILSQVPRTFVNVIGILEAWRVAEISGLVCDILHLALCPCGMNEEDKRTMAKATTEYQDLLQESITSGKFDRDDFAAVFQPFFLDTVLPKHPDGEPDYSYFAPDCFHFSTKAQGAQAIATWNSMIQPVGSKDTSWYPGESVRCPSEAFPYLYTNANSKASWNPADEGQKPDEDQQENPDDEEQQENPDDQQQDGPSAPGADQGALSSGVVAVIVVCALAVVGGMCLLAYRFIDKKPRNPYTQLQ